MAAAGTSHGLGVGHGSLIEHADGSVEYRQTGKLMPAFRVAIRDVTGFSVRKVTKDDKKRLNASSLQQILTIQGSGTTLAEVPVNYQTSEKIERWFRAHKDFGANSRTSHSTAAAASPTPPPAQPAAGSASIFEAIKQLGNLHAAGILTDEEFGTKKAELLARL